MLKHPNFNPVAVDLGVIQIHWYGLMYLAGFVFGWWICRLHSRQGRITLNDEQIADLVFACAIGLVLGGRIGYTLFYGFDRFLENPLWALKIWQGGMSFHGGFIGVCLALVWFSRRQNVTLGALADLAALAVPMGLGFGRIGNFIGQELWGRATTVPWGMVFPHDPLGLARHPSQLYQALLEGPLLFAIIFFFSRRPRPPWAAAGLFILCYGVFRFTVEFFREPDAHIGFDLFGWLSRGQLLSLPMVVAGLIMMIWAYRRQQAQRG